MLLNRCTDRVNGFLPIGNTRKYGTMNWQGNIELVRTALSNIIIELK